MCARGCAADMYLVRIAWHATQCGETCRVFGFANAWQAASKASLLMGSCACNVHDVDEESAWQQGSGGGKRLLLTQQEDQHSMPLTVAQHDWLLLPILHSSATAVRCRTASCA